MTGAEIQLYTVYRRPSPLPYRPLTRWIAILAALLLWWLASGCGHVAPEDVARLGSLSAKLDTARDRVLTQAEVDEAQADIVAIGLTLDQVAKIRAVNEVWSAVQPIASAILMDWISKRTGGAQP